MTLKEADEAAWKFLPVLCNGIEYKRITQTGYRYDERRGRIPFVQLLGKHQNHVVYADPESCTVKDLTEE